MANKCRRGDVVQVILDPAVGAEIKKARPCVIIQNDVGNRFSSVTIVAAIQDAEKVPKLYPVNVKVLRGEGGLEKDSVVLCNQIRTVDESRFGKVYGHFSDERMQEIDQALQISLALVRRVSPAAGSR